ncbi:MAG TPA: TolC family protein [Lacunisphaera sp.]|nr:TolC family protein [Lacunisphaera sp.]
MTKFDRLPALMIAILAVCAGAFAQDAAPVPAQPMVTPPSAGPVGEVPPPQATLPPPANPNAPAAPAQPELTLEECISRALKKNFDLEIGRYNPQIAQDAITVAGANYEPVLTASGTDGKIITGASGTSASSSSRTSDLRVGVTQQLYTGTTLSASSALDRSDRDPAVLALNPAYNADLTLSARQSLLRGFGTNVNRANVHRAEIGLERARLDYKSQVLNVVQSTETAYYNLAFAQEQLAVRNISLDLANRLFEEAKTRRDTGVATDLDVLSAQVGVANAQRNVILAQQSAKDRQDELLALIGQFELDAPVGTVTFPRVAEAAPMFASSYNLAKQNQPDYLSSKAAIDQFKLDLVVAKDATKPDLSVGGALGLNGNRGSAHDAFGDALDSQNHSWQVDFAFSYPWGRKSDKARYRQALATLNREEVRLRQIEQTIEVQVRSAVRSVDANMESVKIAALSSELSQKQYELEKARFDAGLSTSYRVLQAQTDYDNARVNELQARVALNSAVSALHRIEGSSLQRYHVDLP